jgi:dTDP-glucose 4,6-dehydratase
MAVLFITGGAGFIGSNLVRRALERTRDRVVVLDRLTYAGHLASLTEVEANPRYVFEKLDIADRAAVRDAFCRHRPAALLNLAAESHVDRSIDAPSDFIRTNIVGTFELLEATRAFLAEAPPGDRAAFRFVHVSTDEVFGSLGETGLFTEETAYAPNSPYSASKASADHLVRAWGETWGMPVLITNCSNNYGPFQYPEKLVPLMILNALEARPLPIYGDGANVRDWLYVGDHCDAILDVLERGRPGGRYNVGARCEKRNVEVVDALCDALEAERPAVENPALAAAGVARYADLKTFVKDRPGHDRRYAIDPSHIEHELGWRAAHGFEDGLRATVRWYLDNTRWCAEVQGERHARERLGLGEPGDAPLEGRR